MSERPSWLHTGFLFGVLSLLVAIASWLNPFHPVGNSPLIATNTDTHSANRASTVQTLTTVSQDQDSFSVRIPANSAEWIATGHTVRRGDQVELLSKGKVVTTLYGAQSGPEGQQYVCDVDACVASFEPYGALLVRVGAEALLVVGRFRTFQSDDAGELQFIVNDKRGFHDDNTGAYTTSVTVTRRSSP